MSTGMFDVLLNRLSNGETADAIAEDLSKTLNEANQHYQETEKAKRLAATSHEKKVEAATGIADLINGYWRMFYSDVYQSDIPLITDEDLVELFDSIAETMKFVGSTMYMFKNGKGLPGLDKKPDPVDPIAEFLKNLD